MNPWDEFFAKMAAHSLLLLVGLSLVGLSVSKKGEHAEIVAWTVPVHVANLLPNGSFAALAAWRGPVFVEIGPQH